MSWHTDLVGIPYLKRGRDLDGIDCWGLVMYVYETHLNIILPGFEREYDYAAKPEVATDYLAAQDDWDQVEPGDYQEFDVAWFLGGVDAMHVSILIDDKSMLHTHSGVGSVCTARIDRPPWDRLLRGVYRHRGINGFGIR